VYQGFQRKTKEKNSNYFRNKKISKFKSKYKKKIILSLLKFTFLKRKKLLKRQKQKDNPEKKLKIKTNQTK